MSVPLGRRSQSFADEFFCRLTSAAHRDFDSSTHRLSFTWFVNGNSIVPDSPQRTVRNATLLDCSGERVGYQCTVFFLWRHQPRVVHSHEVSFPSKLPRPQLDQTIQRPRAVIVPASSTPPLAGRPYSLWCYLSPLPREQLENVFPSWTIDRDDGQETVFNSFQLLDLPVVPSNYTCRVSGTLHTHVCGKTLRIDSTATYRLAPLHGE